MSTTQQTEAQTETEKVHLGTDCYHSDFAGMPGCIELVWRCDDMDVVTREEAESRGFEPCGRCVDN